VIGLLGIAVFLSSSRISGETPSTRESAADQLLPEFFKDPKTNIEIRLPKGWVIKKGINDTGYQAPKKDQGEKGRLAPSVLFSHEAVPRVRPSDVDAIVEGKREQYPKIFSGYHDETSNITKPDLAGKGVGMISFSVLVSNVVPVQSTQIWIVANKEYYLVTFTSLRETYAANEALFDAMAKTIKVP
jgi:hypothetical protein